MTEINKRILQKRTSIYRVLLHMKNGMKKVAQSRKYQAILAVYLLMACLMAYLDISGDLSSLDTGLVRHIQITLGVTASVIGTMLGAALLFFFFGSPWEAWRVENSLTRAGYYNSAGETPLFLGKEQDPENSTCFFLHFSSVGLPFSKWVDSTELLQNALNVVIGSCEWGKNQQEVILHCASGNFRFPEKIVWKNEYLSHNEGELILGVCATGFKAINLNIYPHILLAGSTGSGKTVFLQTLIWQCILLNYHVTVVDLKGGIDFTGRIWRENIKIVTDLPALDEKMTELRWEMEYRKNMLLTSCCPNLGKYNEKYPYAPYPRRVIVIDELAEVLDKSGLDKAEKNLVDSIERKLSTLIRLGRASGIHCILATQRPDSEILRGQIRSNIDAKFCSRCDSTLSILLLGDAEASTRIPKNELGLFMGCDKVLFKSFILDLKNL